MSQEALETITANLAGLTSGEAMTLFHRMTVLFEWSGTVFTREDATVEWNENQYDTETGLTPEDEMPDAVWEKVLNSWEWRKGIPEVLTERGWELLGTAVLEADDEIKGMAGRVNYEPMVGAAPHTCWDRDDYDGVIMPDECAGCAEAEANPCKWCGYGGCFTTHAPEAHAENGDPNVTDIDNFGPEWTDVPHIYKES